MISYEKDAQWLQDRVMTYANNIKLGNTVAGKKTRQMIRRFYKDYERIDKEDFPYYIDWMELVKVYHWAKLFKHRKGVLAGKPIELEDFQLFLLMNILCFKRKDTEYKRYREAYIQLARKNAKSQLLAIMTSYVTFLSPESEEGYITGYAKDQSNLVYDEILAQIDAATLLSGTYNSSYNRIKVNKNGSIIKALSRESRRFGDGTNPSFVVVDEYHTHPTDEIVDVQRTGMMARPNPQIIYITTAGLNVESPCHSYYEYCSKILNPNLDTENDNIFVAIYEADAGDDISKFETWQKANPLLTTYEAGIESLKSDLKMAQDQPEKMRAFLTKNMNLWVDHKEDGYMDLSKWNKCYDANLEREEFMRNANIYIGIDLSSRLDLTSVGMVAVYQGKFLVEQHSFVPETKFLERMSRDKVRYDLFEEQGLLSRTDGDSVDYSFVRDYVLSMTKKYNVMEVCYDPWNSTHLANELTEQGCLMVEIPQRITHLSNPTKNFREFVYESKVLHTDDGLLRWALNNVVLKVDDQENIMISKSRSMDRIDPIAAILNAFSRAIYDDQMLDLNTYFMSDGFSL